MSLCLKATGEKPLSKRAWVGTRLFLLLLDDPTASCCLIPIHSLIWALRKPMLNGTNGAGPTGVHEDPVPASWSAASFPGTPEWPGTHRMTTSLDTEATDESREMHSATREDLTKVLTNDLIAA